jgi:hypothetical protein
MPEGIGPGSGVLQETVKKIYGDFGDWCILLFDNALLLASDYQDAYMSSFPRHGLASLRSSSLVTCAGTSHMV